MNGESSEILEQFFRQLAEDRRLYNDYLTDPLTTMRNWRPEGWEGEEQALPEDLIGAILQGDLHHLNKLFAERGREQDAGAMIILGTIVRW